MVGEMILHYKILEKLGEAYLLPILSGFGRQGGPVRRNLTQHLRGKL